MISDDLIKSSSVNTKRAILEGREIIAVMDGVVGDTVSHMVIDMLGLCKDDLDVNTGIDYRPRFTLSDKLYNLLVDYESLRGYSYYNFTGQTPPGNILYDCHDVEDEKARELIKYVWTELPDKIPSIGDIITNKLDGEEIRYKIRDNIIQRLRRQKMIEIASEITIESLRGGIRNEKLRHLVNEPIE